MPEKIKIKTPEALYIKESGVLACIYNFFIRKEVASRKGFEPLTDGLEGRCSIQLSYRDTA